MIRIQESPWYTDEFVEYRIVLYRYEYNSIFYYVTWEEQKIHNIGELEKTGKFWGHYDLLPISIAQNDFNNREQKLSRIYKLGEKERI